MSVTPVIHLLKGFCALPFGSTIESALLAFGEPDEMQELNDDVLQTSSMVYHYWDNGFSLFFDNHRNRSLISVEIDNRQAILFDVVLFSLKEKELIALMKSNGFAMTDSEMHNWGEKRVSFDSAGLDCYFENNRLVSVNFGIGEMPEGFSFFPN